MVILKHIMGRLGDGWSESLDDIRNVVTISHVDSLHVQISGYALSFSSKELHGWAATVDALLASVEAGAVGEHVVELTKHWADDGTESVTAVCVPIPMVSKS